MTNILQNLFSLESWIFESQKHITWLLDNGNTVVVLVAWWTASGKTSRVAEKISHNFENSQILSMDNYYRWHKFMEEQKSLWNELNWDQPEALNLELFFEHLSELKSGKTIYAPYYDFKTEPVFHSQKIIPSSLIIVEWLFALHDNIEKLWDYNIFVDIWSHGQILRRIFRDIQRTGEAPKEILQYFLDVVEPMHSRYILPTKSSADIIISNDYNPEIESKNSLIKESNIKYPIYNDITKELENIIYKLWWNYVGEVVHSDRYFNPSDNELSLNDEYIRIRKLDNSQLLFSYIWPDSKMKPFEQRFHMRFFIDEMTYQSFKHVYKKKIKEIVKTRKSYYVSGILISVDTFNSWEKYLVLRFDDKFTRIDALKLLEYLKIDPLSGLNNVYFNLLK